MLKSMTTFAKTEAIQGGLAIRLECKSVNSRFCEVFLKAQGIKGALQASPEIEERLRRKVQQRLGRGKIDIVIGIERIGEAGVSFEPDIALAKGYVAAVNRLGGFIRIAPAIDMSTLLLALPGAIRAVEVQPEENFVWEALEAEFDRLLELASQGAEREGNSLELDVRNRIDRIGSLLHDVEVRFGVRKVEARQTFQKRLEDILQDVRLDEARLHQEVAILLDRMDITEELVRAKSHLSQFCTYLEVKEPVGRRLDFLLQELFREINTLSVKAQDAHISMLAVEIKGEMEKVREQVQNIV